MKITLDTENKVLSLEFFDVEELVHHAKQLRAMVEFNCQSPLQVVHCLRYVIDLEDKDERDEDAAPAESG